MSPHNTITVTVYRWLNELGEFQNYNCTISHQGSVTEIGGRKMVLIEDIAQSCREYAKRREIDNPHYFIKTNFGPSSDQEGLRTTVVSGDTINKLWYLLNGDKQYARSRNASA